MKKKFVFIAIFLASIFILGACGSNSELVGRWESSAASYQFNSNGSGYDIRWNAIQGANVPTEMTWSVSDGRLTILSTFGVTEFQSFDVINNQLILRTPAGQIFTLTRTQ